MNASPNSITTTLCSSESHFPSSYVYQHLDELIKYLTYGFPLQFLKYAGNTRSNIASRARSAAGQIFVGLRSLFDAARMNLERQGKWPSDHVAQRPHIFQQSLFDIDFDRSQVPVFLDLLGFDARKKDFKRWCKVLYADFRDDLPSGLFKNEALIRVSFSRGRRMALIHS